MLDLPATLPKHENIEDSALSDGDPHTARSGLHRVVMAMLCTVGIIAGSGTTAAAQDPIDPSPQLGLAFPGSQPQFYPFIREAGISVVRLTADWSLIEPRPGSFDFRGLDSRIAALQRQGLVPFVTFESPSSWYSRPGTGETAKNSEPADLRQWAEFVTRVVERYDGDGTEDAPGVRSGVRYFQAANEFVSPTNRSGGWDGSNAALLEYINVAHDSVRRASADAVFVLGGIASFNMDVALLAETSARFHLQQRWSEDSMTVYGPKEINSAEIQALLNDRFKFVLREARYDWASVHLYGPEDRDAARIAYMRKQSGRPVVSTECGGPSLDYDTAYSPSDHARAVLERNLGVLAEGLPFCLWLGLGEEMQTTWGNRRVPLYDLQRRPKPGINAYRLLAQMLGEDGTVLRLEGDGGFLIEGARGRFCAASDASAAGALVEACGADTLAFCWDGTGGSVTWSGRAGDMAGACEAAVVLIVGDGATALRL